MYCHSATTALSTLSDIHPVHQNCKFHTVVVVIVLIIISWDTYLKYMYILCGRSLHQQQTTIITATCSIEGLSFIIYYSTNSTRDQNPQEHQRNKNNQQETNQQERFGKIIQ